MGCEEAVGQVDDLRVIVDDEWNVDAAAVVEEVQERETLRAGLARAADLVRSETFPATTGPHCRDCSFTAICPARGAGSVTVQ